MAVFWEVAPCSLVQIYRRFRGTYCLHHQGPDDEALNTFEMSVLFYQTTRPNFPEESYLNSRRRENLKSIQ
jgi:hypothetical protein